MYIYFLIAVIFVYALYKERQALGCRTIPNGVDCDNRNGKVVKGTTPSLNDSTEVLLAKLEKIAHAHEEFVAWRISFMLAVVATLLVFYVCFQRLPSEVETMCSVLAIFSIIYFSFNFYNYHVWRYISQNTEDIADYLKTEFK
jgi:hypothetical protein